MIGEIMAKCIARKPGASKSISKSVSFTKDEESGFYKKITQDYIFDSLLGTTKKEGKKIISESNYKISDENNYDHAFEVSGPDGKRVVIFFKEI